MSLILREVRKSYGSAEVLRGVSLEAEYGQVVAIVGANGAGKSTYVIFVYRGDLKNHDHYNHRA